LKPIFLLSFIFLFDQKQFGQSNTFIAINGNGTLSQILKTTNNCVVTNLTFCNNFKNPITNTANRPLSIALKGDTIYVVDNQGYLYSNTLGSSGTVGNCVLLGQFLGKSSSYYGMTVGPAGVIYVASGSDIETYNSNTQMFNRLGSIPTRYSVAGDLLIWEGDLYEVVKDNGPGNNPDALLKIDLTNPSLSTVYLRFNAGLNIFGIASITVPCFSNRVFALSSNSAIYELDMLIRTMNTTISCSTGLNIFDAASVAETQNALNPDTPAVKSPIDYCKNDPVQPLIAFPSNARDTLRWYNSPTGGSSTAAPQPSTASTGTTTYYVSQFDTLNKCEGPRNKIVVNVHDYPNTPSINPNGSIVLCNGETQVLTASGAAAYQWYKDGFPISNSNTQTIEVKEVGNFHVVISNVYGCSVSSPPTNIAVASASIQYLGSPFCKIGSTNVTRTGTIGGVYRSNPTGLVLDSVNGDINLNNSSYGAHTVTYLYQNKQCKSSASIEIVKEKTSKLDEIICKESLPYSWQGFNWNKAGVQQKKLVTSLGCDSFVYYTLSIEEANFKFTLDPKLIYTDDSAVIQLSHTIPFKSLTWLPSQFFQKDQTIQRFKVGDSSFVARIIFISNRNCQYQDTFLVKIKPKTHIYIPNTFLPSSLDGEFNTFKIFGAELAEASLEILNQWGQVIAVISDGLKVGWNGQSDDEPQPTGVYVYIAKLTFLSGKKEIRTGSINLIR
jgi:hypothetical protein